MWSAALGSPILMTRKYCADLFKKFAGDKDQFNKDDFSKQMKQNPDMLAWFSKPEEAINNIL